MALLNELQINYISPLVIYQDNKSTITMAKAGRGSFKRSKHIANRYYWIKQFIDSGEIVVEYKPTNEMIADFLTKPMSGPKFADIMMKLFNR
jgi:hypothetical protein